MKILLVLMSFVSCVAIADQNLRGTWKGENYNFNIDTTFNYIRGTYGDRSFDLSVDGTFNYVRGKSAGHDVNMSFDSTFKYARGTASCGEMNLSYDTTFNYIRGTYCSSEMNQSFSSSEEVREAFRFMVMDELVSDFPAPTHHVILRFISSKIHF